MDILNLKPDEKTTKPEIEAVVKEQTEYKLINTILRTPGLGLYAYNAKKDVILPVKIEAVENCYTKGVDGRLVVDYQKNYEKSNIDPRNIHFEALNSYSAYRRVEKFKQGLIKDLCNLRFEGDRKPLTLY